MSLKLDLRANGELIGTIRANHAPGCLACFSRPHATRHEYVTEIREICADVEVARKVSTTRHAPELGAWALIQAILDQHPKRAWNR